MVTQRQSLIDVFLDFFHCPLRSVVNHVIVYDKKTHETRIDFLSISALNGRLRLGSFNSFVAVVSGGVLIGLNFVILRFDLSNST